MNNDYMNNQDIKERSLIMLEYLKRKRYKYIARNKDNSLIAYRDPILKDSEKGEWFFISSSPLPKDMRCTYLEEELFPEITWGDKREYVISTGKIWERGCE